MEFLIHHRKDYPLAINETMNRIKKGDYEWDYGYLTGF